MPSEQPPAEACVTPLPAIRRRHFFAANPFPASPGRLPARPALDLQSSLFRLGRVHRRRKRRGKQPLPRHPATMVFVFRSGWHRVCPSETADSVDRSPCSTSGRRRRNLAGRRALRCRPQMQMVARHPLRQRPSLARQKTIRESTT